LHITPPDIGKISEVIHRRNYLKPRKVVGELSGGA